MIYQSNLKSIILLSINMNMQLVIQKSKHFKNIKNKTYVVKNLKIYFFP